MAEIPDPPCLVELRALKASIDEAMNSGQVQSIGRKDRNVAYVPVNVNDRIRYYNQLWKQCPAAQEELPQLTPLDGPQGGTRGRPARYVGRSHV